MLEHNGGRCRISRVPWAALAVLALLVDGVPGVALAAGQDEAAPTLRLVSPQASAGNETFTTIMLDSVPGQPVQVIKAQIDFPTAQLTYVTSRLGFSGEIADATLDVTQRTAEDKPAPGESPLAAGKARLVVVVTGKKPIQTGPVAEMRMQVAPDLNETEVKLDFRAEALAPQNEKVANLAVTEADPLRITSAPPQLVPKVFACFFYMH